MSLWGLVSTLLLVWHRPLEDSGGPIRVPLFHPWLDKWFNLEALISPYKSQAAGIPVVMDHGGSAVCWDPHVWTTVGLSKHWKLEERMYLGFFDPQFFLFCVSAFKMPLLPLPCLSLPRRHLLLHRCHSVDFRAGQELLCWGRHVIWLFWNCFCPLYLFELWNPWVGVSVQNMFSALNSLWL